MIERIIIAGAGGQGVMLLGKVMAEAALKEGKHVTWFPCYGAEVRGGTANCTVVIADTPIGSPYVQKSDTLIILNEPSWIKFKDRIKPGGLLLVNSSLIDKGSLRPLSKVKLFAYAFTDGASNLGDVRVANMIALGSFLAHKKILKPQTIREVMVKMAPSGKQELVAINEKALEEGLKLHG
jgi:2-oxoglutarate ferredoxin oxidoreductase subunit gamma